MHDEAVHAAVRGRLLAAGELQPVFAEEESARRHRVRRPHERHRRRERPPVASAPARRVDGRRRRREMGKSSDSRTLHAFTDAMSDGPHGGGCSQHQQSQLL